MANFYRCCTVDTRRSDKCPKCGINLSGSASKGRNRYYYYYHCHSGCNFRVKAELPNKLFTQIRNIENLLDNATNALSNLDVLYKNGSTKTKREIIGSMFFEGLVFDGTQLRTENVNEASRLIFLINN